MHDQDAELADCLIALAKSGKDQSFIDKCEQLAVKDHNIFEFLQLWMKEEDDDERATILEIIWDAIEETAATHKHFQDMNIVKTYNIELANGTKLTVEATQEFLEKISRHFDVAVDELAQDHITKYLYDTALHARDKLV